MLIVDRCLFLYHVEEEARAVRIIDFRHGSQLPQPGKFPQEPRAES